MPKDALFREIYKQDINVGEGQVEVLGQDNNPLVLDRVNGDSIPTLESTAAIIGTNAGDSIDDALLKLKEDIGSTPAPSYPQLDDEDIDITQDTATSINIPANSRLTEALIELNRRISGSSVGDKSAISYTLEYYGTDSVTPIDGHMSIESDYNLSTQYAIRVSRYDSRGYDNSPEIIGCYFKNVKVGDTLANVSILDPRPGIPNQVKSIQLEVSSISYNSTDDYWLIVTDEFDATGAMISDMINETFTTLLLLNPTLSNDNQYPMQYKYTEDNVVAGDYSVSGSTVSIHRIMRDGDLNSTDNYDILSDLKVDDYIVLSYLTNKANFKITTKPIYDPLGFFTFDVTITGNPIFQGGSVTSMQIVKMHAPDVRDVTKEHTGYEDTDTISVTYDSVGRSVVVNGSPVSAYYRSVKLEDMIDGWESSPHETSPTGALFLYYNGTDYVWSSDPWEFYDLQIASILYSSNGNFLIGLKETHGFMPWQDHQEFHEMIGTHLESGCDISNVVLDSIIPSERRPYFSEATVHDEDNHTILPALTTNIYSQLTFSGVDIANITDDKTDIVPLLAERPYYNFNNDGTWEQKLLEDGEYMNVYVMAIPVTNDTVSQKRRFLHIQGQNAYSTKETAELESARSLDLGELGVGLPEYAFANRITIQYKDNNWSVISYDKLSQNRVDTNDGVSITDAGVSVISPPTSSPSGVSKTVNVALEDITSNIDNLYAAISSLAGATGDIIGDAPTAVPDTATVGTFALGNQSSNTDIFEIDAANNHVTFKEPGDYFWLSDTTFTNSSNRTRNFRFITRDKNNTGTIFSNRIIAVDKDGITSDSTLTKFTVVNPNTVVEILYNGETIDGDPNDDITLESWVTDITLERATSPSFDYLPKAGGTMSGAINMDSNQINNLPIATLDEQPLRLKEFNSGVANYLALAGGTMSGDIGMGGNNINDGGVGDFSSILASGSVSGGNARIQTWSGNSDYARFGHDTQNVSTTYGFLQGLNSDCFIRGANIYMESMVGDMNIQSNLAISGSIVSSDTIGSKIGGGALTYGVFYGNDITHRITLRGSSDGGAFDNPTIVAGDVSEWSESGGDWIFRKWNNTTNEIVMRLNDTALSLNRDLDLNGNDIIDGGDITFSKSNALITSAYSGTDTTGVLFNGSSVTLRSHTTVGGYASISVDKNSDIMINAGSNTSPNIITIDLENPTGTNGNLLKIIDLPTSSSGLSTGDVWNDSGTLKIV